MNLAEVAADLYAVPPDEFVAAREAHQDRARREGDRGLASRIGKLRKPSTAAWAVNLLSRELPAEVAQLAELGNLLRQAQRGLAGDEVKELTQRRHQLVVAMRRQAADLARDRGRPLSRAIAAQVEDTFRAAITDEAAGRAVTAGVLTSALSASGFGGVDLSGSVADVPGADERGAGGAGRRGRGGDRPAASEEVLRRTAAELEQVDSAVGDAEAEAAAAEDRVEEAGTRRRRLQDRIRELEAELRQLQKDVGRSADELRAAQGSRDAARRRLRDATRHRDRVRGRLDRLRDDGRG